jgi:peptidoglycan/xylan/chitin deacetylase (PgdA/CDA1 family)
MADVSIAVIAAAGGEVLERCLAALAAQGAFAAVYTVTADGAATARNEALAQSSHEVLALLDDDVVVSAGWLDAVRRAWDVAGADVAVVGGPLAVQPQGDLPRWWVDTMAVAFGGVELGDAAIDVDLRDRTFPAANVTFRVSALRGVGGLWPARGHRHGRDWFSAEHQAQHALSDQGWYGRYEPAVAATLVPRLRRADLVMRRLRYGARLSEVGGGRTAREAAAALARGAAGVVTAPSAARRMERALRMAENAGALVGRPFVRRDFEPTVASTPFRPSIPKSTTSAPPPNAPCVLLYHRVADVDHDPLQLAVSKAHFAEQMEVLTRDRTVIPLDTLVRSASTGTARPTDVAVTFDDGYADNLLAAEVLRAQGLPWTLFVSTGHVEDGLPFWWDEVRRLLHEAPPSASSHLTLELPGGMHAWRTTNAEERERARSAISTVLQALSGEAIGAALSALRQWSTVTTEFPESQRPMTVRELQDLAATGVSVGAHTRTHRGLAYAPTDAQREEVERSRNDLTQWLGTPPRGFSYPFGVPEAELDEATERVVRQAGFAYAVVNVPAPVPGADIFAVPRRAVPDLSGAAFRSWLSGSRVGHA